MFLENEIASRSELSGANQTLREKRPERPAPDHQPARILRRAVRNNVPLSFAQQRLWFLDQLYPASPQYNFPIALRVTGALNRGALERSLSAIVARHEVLRTCFVSVEGNPTQIISEPEVVALQMTDLSQMPAAAREAEAQRLLSMEAKRPFNLARDPMMRCLLLQLGATEHILMVTIHHIATDAWSAGIFIRELAAGYEAFSAERTLSLPELPIQYADYALWKREQLQGEVLERQLAYWKKQLAGAKEFLELPTDRPRPAAQTFRGAVEAHCIRQETVKALRQISRRERATLFMVLLAAFKTLLYRYSRQDDILVGSPIAGRSQFETEGSIGFFVNTLVLRSDLSGNPTFRELLAREREVVFGAIEHQDLPFEKLVEELHPERNVGQGPLIQVMFVLQNAPSGELKLGELAVVPLEVSHETSKFDLTLMVEEQEQELTVKLEYNVDLFDAATVKRLAGHWEMLLEGIAADPEQRLLDLPLLTEAERRQVLLEWNRTKYEYPRERCVHELFEEQARMRPDAIAVTFGEHELTYEELNVRANQLAHYLKRSGVRAGEVVGICVERSLEMVVGLLGILKAGGAYASLDPASPQERLAYMLDDLRARVLLTQGSLTELWQGKMTTKESISPQLRICLDIDWSRIGRMGTDDPHIGIGAESLAYVSFTSGSTGRPKGVCVPHRGVVRLVKNANYANFSSEEVFLQLAPISFDASTMEIWGCLLNGARLVVFPPQTPSLAELAETLERHRVTTVWLTSGLFNQMIEEKPEGLKHLRQILTGGDVLSPTHVKKALALLDRCQLINGYGPTENTTFTACYTIPVSYGGQRSIPIGRPISNTQCYVLDERLQPVPVGIPGELYAGGDGLALGYLNQPELTAEKFIPNPFQPGSRLYKTGDLVRYLADGNIEFLGRMDYQVKIRGFRVELGEIESVLARHPLVRECVVMARQDFPGEKRLTAYIVAGDGEEPVARELRQFLKGKLPDYMAPSVYMRLKALPLMPNGKVDRHALPVPNDGKAMLDKEYVKPVDSLELELTAIWESILNTRPIGVEDKFFDLGGHSLLAVRLVAQVEKKFGRKLPVAVVFQAPTIREMAGFLRAEKSVTASSSLVEIQAKGSKPAIYFVHGVGGGMFWGYTNLARSLGLDQPVYALKSRAMDGEEEFSRIEAMAAQYIADVREFQPKGPYHLGGYCFGGNVAYEMARQLHAAGETVALLAVMNAAPPNSSYGRLRWTPGGVIKFLVNFSYLAARSLKWGAQQRKEFVLWKAALSRRRVMRFLKISHAAAKQIDVDDIVDLSTFPQDQRKLWETHIRALIGYFPQPYPGKITLFRSRGHPLFSSFDAQFGWGDLAGEVEVQAVPGAHESILEEPHVRILAEQLKECMRRTQGNQTVSSSKRSSVDNQPVSISVARSNWKEAQADFPRDLCIHHLFEEQVKRTPDAPALICAGEELSYLEVNRRANQIAHQLQSLGVGPDVPVGICLKRSINLVVGMLGILKAGGAYVPLDPAYPQERLALMLKDAQAPILLTQTELASSLPAEQRKIVCLDQCAATEALEHNPVRGATAQSLAYVIYTSGSTGQPKGVAMAHQPLVNLIWWQLKNSSLAKGDRTLQFSSPSFDVSFQEIFSTWCSGGVLVLIDEQLRHDASGLRRFLHEQKINRLFLPFIALSQLAESVSDQDPLPSGLREVITAGEQLRITAKIAALFEKLPGCVLYNHYGPTESHVVTSFALEGPPSSWAPLPPIGRPIANTQIHLLDEKHNAVPAGETGELYIGGECLAHGYLHRPDLTAERFIPDPFSLEPSARLYKTGDLARYLPDGNIEYIGRADQQVKIHGYRVELGEIETVLGTHPAVRECVVVAREDVPGQKRLVGYVVLQPGWEVTITGLRHALEEKLPDYMVPSSFACWLEALPVTPSGKVNRLGLPAPDQNRPRLDEKFVAPSNDTEERLAAIWREVLSLKQVGTQDNFFELGGNSLMVGCQVVSSEYGKPSSWNCQPAVCSTPRRLPPWPKASAPVVGGTGNRQSCAPIKRGGADDQAPLSFAQRRLWFIDRLEPGGHAYNVPVAIHLQGTLNAEVLQISLEKIMRRHESLRTVISFTEGKLTQAVSPEPGAILSRVDLEAWPASQQKLEARKVVDAEAQRPFNLALGPLLRCTLIRLGEREHIFVVVMHHIISDGWSLAVFFKELNLLYKALSTGKPPPILPALPVQYRDYARCQQEWMQGTVLEKAVSYWKEKLKDAPSSIELPLDHEAELESATRSALSSVVLPQGLAREMAEFGRREAITPFMTMMAGLAITLHPVDEAIRHGHWDGRGRAKPAGD